MNIYYFYIFKVLEFISLYAITMALVKIFKEQGLTSLGELLLSV